MAKFNPDISKNDPDFLHYSKGGGNSWGAFGALFDGIGDLVGGAARTADAHIQGNIRRDLNREVDFLNDEFGLNARSDTEASINPEFSQPSPEGLQSNFEQLSKLKKAHAQGALSETAYWGRLYSVVRQMRTRYPGYREQIDEHLAGALGNPAANQLRNSMFQEMEAELRASNKANEDYESFLNSKAKYLPVGYQDMAPEDVKHYARMQEMKEHSVTAEKSSLELRAKRGENIAEDAYRFGLDYVETVFTDAVDRSFAAVLGGEGNNTYESFQKMFAEFAKDGITPEEDFQLRQTLGQVKEFARSSLLRQLGNSESGPSLLTQMGSSKEKEVMDALERRFAAFEEGLFNPESGQLNLLKLNIEAQKNAQLNKFFQQNPKFKEITVLSQSVGPQVMSVILTGDQDGTLLSAISAIPKSLVLDGIAGSTTPDSALDMMDKAGVANPKNVQTYFRDSIRVITDPGIPSEKKAALASKFFQPGDYKFFGRLSSDSKLKVYRDLTSPAVVNAMRQLADRDPTVWDNYKNWAVNAFNVVAAKPIADLNERGLVTDDLLRYQYDPKTNQFTLKVNEGSFRRTLKERGTNTIGESYDMLKASRAEKAVAEMNKYLKGIEPIVKTGGGDVGATMAGVLVAMGADGGPKSSLWTAFIELIEKTYSSDNKKETEGDTEE